ncbi:MAG TPA: glycosyl hydrolase family 8 [Acetivibrio sp.]|uniref:glycosyl hydrolase family 8 n=1 Tax=Acetivibrio sp. TaxID=1872092 RepID=UPI002CAE6A2B|nr:glycosyl hydrolase family 8 [Acetivibrio sp.]HOM02026.1 glycosyl hydrolase family 8 [Acetivibrio sp.]
MKEVKKRVGAILLILAVLGAFVLSVPMNNVSAAGVPFNTKYAYGVTSIADNQAEANAMLRREWEDWKSKRVTSNGAGGYKRVQRDASTNYDTVSEGLGYGLLLSVCFDDRAVFDDLYRYAKSHFNGNGLMHWHIDANNNVTTHDGGNGAATDADEDIALALIFADKLWGSSGSINYRQEAITLINNLYNHCVEHGSNVLKPGDMWGGSSVTNPSYFAPAWYKVYAQYTGDTRWNQVADKCYQIVEEVKKYNNGTGLVPDWCTASGTQASGQGYDYKYDATRYGWRTAVDYSWFGDSRAKANCDALTKFFARDGVKGIGDGYTIQGSKFSNNHNASFVGPVAAASMTGYDMNFAKELYKETVAVKDDEYYGYYGNSLRLLTLLYITGNFPNPLQDLSSPLPSPSNPSPTPTNQYITYGDVNGDGNVNSTDLNLLKRYLLKQTENINRQAADVNKDGTINSSDWSILKRYLIKSIPYLPY